MTEAAETVFAGRLALLHASVDVRAAGRLARYQAMLEDWNTRMNLTGDAGLEATLDRHFMDSLAPLQLVGLFPQGATLVDVGTGAGFPGLALAIARPDLQITLLDSLQKRLTFLDAVIDALELPRVRTVHARAEDAARDPALRERFDLAVARAVAAAPVLLELLLPFVRAGGQALCYKGPAAAEELEGAAFAARLLGGAAPRALAVEVPLQPEWRHCVLACAKVRPTPERYPRKAGVPAREPLDTLR